MQEQVNQQVIDPTRNGLPPAEAVVLQPSGTVPAEQLAVVEAVDTGQLALENAQVAPDAFTVPPVGPEVTEAITGADEATRQSGFRDRVHSVWQNAKGAINQVKDFTGKAAFSAGEFLAAGADFVDRHGNTVGTALGIDALKNSKQREAILLRARASAAGAFILAGAMGYKPPEAKPQTA